MKQESTCIYCGSKDFCDAHILPECLGRFKGLSLQKDIVCSECDHEIGRAEEQLAKCGMEALLKTHLDIKGKKKHKSTSPFRRRHAGQGPIELKALYPGEDYPVYVEPIGDGENAQPLPQLLLIDSQKKHYCIRLSNPKETTVEYLKKEIGGSGLKGRLRVETVGMTNDEIDFIFGLLKICDSSMNEESTPNNKKHPTKKVYTKVPAKGKVIVDARYFRAIAKIGFHYFLQYSEYFNGHEDCFFPLKQFIRYGKGKAECFVEQKRGNLVSDFKHGFRPKYYGNIIIGDFHNNSATADVQLFIGRDYDPPYYKITLAKNCLQIQLDKNTFGHFFSYYTPDNREQYTGEIQELGVANKIQLPGFFRSDGI